MYCSARQCCAVLGKKFIHLLQRSTDQGRKVGFCMKWEGVLTCVCQYEEGTKKTRVRQLKCPIE